MHHDILGWLMDPKITTLVSEMLLLFANPKYFIDLPLEEKMLFLMAHQSYLPFVFYLPYLLFPCYCVNSWGRYVGDQVSLAICCQHFYPQMPPLGNISLKLDIS